MSMKMKAHTAVVEIKTDKGEYIERKCLILPKDMPDSVCDEVLREMKDGGFDLVFHGWELKHYAGIGTTIFFHPLNEINLGALQ